MFVLCANEPRFTWNVYKNKQIISDLWQTHKCKYALLAVYMAVYVYDYLSLLKDNRLVYKLVQ